MLRCCTIVPLYHIVVYFGLISKNMLIVLFCNMLIICKIQDF